MNRLDIQKQAVEALLNSSINGKVRGTIEAITGIGKTFIALMMIQKLKPKNILFLAESSVRETTINDDIMKYKGIFGYDILSNHNVEFMCYQSAYKKRGLYHELVIADEIHDSLTPEYFKYYENNNYYHLIGLSATIDKTTIFKRKDDTEYTKIELLNTIAPIVFTYTIKQGQDDNVSRKLNVYIIEHDLDNVNKTIPVSYKDKTGKMQTFFTTEKEYYEYCHQRYIKSMFSGSEFLQTYWRNKRNNILYSLPSKTKAINDILLYTNLKRTIVFGNSISELLKIGQTVSNKNSSKVNKTIIDEFNNGTLDTICSFKMLKQGVNLHNLNNVVIHSYYSIEKDFIQRVGRLRYKDEAGIVIIFMTKNTQEEYWMKKIKEAVDITAKYTTLKNIIRDVLIS